LVDGRITFPQALGLVIVQTVTTNLVGTVAGAASYIAMLRQRYNVEVGKGIASLLLARFGDILALTVALTVSIRVLWVQLAGLRDLILLLLMAMGGFVVVFGLVFVLRARIVVRIRRVLAVLPLKRSNFVYRAADGLAGLAEQHPEQLRRLIGPFLAYSGIAQALAFGFAFCMIRLFVIPVGPWSVMFVTTLTQLMALVPIQVLGGLGVTDVTVMYLYSLFGVSQRELAPVVIGGRMVFYVLNLLLLLYLPLERRMAHDSHDHVKA
jgi:uncharacterized membrane protein YbhN (UPF0104 family)